MPPALPTQTARTVQLRPGLRVGAGARGRVGAADGRDGRGSGRDRHQAQVAADFAALAGAAYAINGETVACARAGELATANGAQLTGCRLDGLDLAVTVAVPVTGPAAVAGPATATARAGPIRSPTTSG